MGLFRDDIVFKPYGFNNSVLTLTRLDTNETKEISCLNMIKAEPAEDKVDTFEVASGTSIPTINPSKKGSLSFGLMEGSPETDWISDTENDTLAISWSFSDENAPNMSCSCGYAHIQKHPPVERTNEVPVPEWLVIGGYVKIKGGSFALYATT